MERSNSLLVVLVLTCQSCLLFLNSVKGQELLLKPSGDAHVRQLGAQFLLTCEVEGGDEDVEYKIQWIGADGKEVAETTGRRYVEEDGLNVKKLFITNIAVEDAGDYTCKTSVAGKGVEKKTRLTVFKGITFDNAPSPQYLKIYTNAFIRCEVSGDPKPEISWRYNGGRRISFVEGGRYVKHDLRGLTIKNITTADSGEYTCRAIVESDGRMEEKKIKVEVHIPPTIREGPGIVEGVEGGSATLTCSASETSLPKAKFEFFKNGRDEAVASTDTIKVDEVGGTVLFEALRKSDEGNYTCTASNDVGKDSAVGTLQVLVKAMVNELNNVTINETQTATLVCKSQGDPPPEMTFSKQGHTPFANDESRDRVTVEAISPRELKLTIKQVKPEDSGNYVCSTKNKLSSHEKTGSITVNYKPRFASDSPHVVRGWAGVSRDVKCSVTGHPRAKIEWYLRGQPLSENGSFSVRESEPTVDAPHRTTSFLSVTINEADQSWIYTNYTCRATNQLGSESLSIELKRASVPSQPRSVTVHKHMPTMIILDVEEPEEDGGVPIVGYRVEYKNQQIYDVAVGSKIKLENLEPNKSYSLLVRAKNEVGPGPAFNLTAHTDPITTPFPVAITSPNRGRFANRYNVTWEHPETGGRPIKKYEFRLRPVKVEEVNGTVTVAGSTTGSQGTTQWQKYEIPDEASAPMTSFLLTDLKELTWYQLEIRSENAQGWSQINEQFLFQTSNEKEHTAPSTAPAIGVGIVLIITVVVLIVILVVVDLSCYFVNNCGVTSLICTKFCGRTASLSKENDAEKGDSKEALTEKQSPVKEPLNNETTTETNEKPPLDTQEAAAEADDLDEKPLLIDNVDDTKVEKADDDDEPVKTKIEDDENEEKSEEQKEEGNKQEEPASQPTEADDTTKSSEPAAGEG